VTENSFAAESKLFEALENHSQPCSHNEGRPLFRQGDSPRGVYIVKSGEIALGLKSSSGKQLTVFVAGPGSILGLPAVVGSKPYSLTAVARKISAVRLVPCQEFDDLMQARPSLQFNVLKVLAAEVRSARLALCETVAFSE